MAEYAQTFGATMNQDVELVSIRASTTVPLPRRDLKYSPKQGGETDLDELSAYSFERKTRMPFRIIPRGQITGTVNGPAIVTEDTTTTYVDADWTMSVGNAGELTLERMV